VDTGDVEHSTDHFEEIGQDDDVEDIRTTLNIIKTVILFSIILLK
jgi:hypothetical protein